MTKRVSERLSGVSGVRPDYARVSEYRTPEIAKSLICRITVLPSQWSGLPTTVLADRLARLVAHEMLTKADDPTHKQKAIYSLTEKAIALLPIIVQIGAWGSRWVTDAKKLDKPSRKFLRALQDSGPSGWAKRMDELRAAHLC